MNKNFLTMKLNIYKLFFLYMFYFTFFMAKLSFILVFLINKTFEELAQGSYEIFKKMNKKSKTKFSRNLASDIFLGASGFINQYNIIR